jgi:hypothetical protein
MIIIGRRTQNSVRSTLTTKQLIIKRLQHLSCAQLLMSTVGTCEMAVGRQVPLLSSPSALPVSTFECHA